MEIRPETAKTVFEGSEKEKKFLEYLVETIPLKLQASNDAVVRVAFLPDSNAKVLIDAEKGSIISYAPTLNYSPRLIKQFDEEQKKEYYLFRRGTNELYQIQVDITSPSHY